MPGFDGTGPSGRGPMTGGGRGYCNPSFAGTRDPYMGNPYAGPYGGEASYGGYPYGGEASYGGYPYGRYPNAQYQAYPYGGFGWGRGMGRGCGMGRGRGRGMGRGFGW